MNLELDFRSGIPIYLQVVERFKEFIASGRLAPGDQLPTVRSLALELRVNFNTVARAYRILDEVGIISTQQGLTQRYLADAERFGASPEELDQILKDQMAHWQQTGHLSNPEPDHE
jgi:GntR family transcriptional regulator